MRFQEILDDLLHGLYNSGWVEGESYAEKTFDGRQLDASVISDREKRKVATARAALTQLFIEEVEQIIGENEPADKIADPELWLEQVAQNRLRDDQRARLNKTIEEK